jgi:hypothetical protein
MIGLFVQDRVSDQNNTAMTRSGSDISAIMTGSQQGGDRVRAG